MKLSVVELEPKTLDLRSRSGKVANVTYRNRIPAWCSYEFPGLHMVGRS